jgi:hypothetical protein
MIRVVFLSVLAALTLAAADPTLGAWKLNLAKSHYDPGPAPRSSTAVYTQDGDWVVIKVESVAADGTASNFNNRYKRDGKEYPYRGPLGSGTIAVTKIDDRHYQAALKLDSGTSKVLTEISADGKVRTQTATGSNAKGKLHNVSVFDRQ